MRKEFDRHQRSFSWDDKYVLIGTSIENIDVITIEHWERIVKNETWFEGE